MRIEGEKDMTKLNGYTKGSAEIFVRFRPLAVRPEDSRLISRKAGSLGACASANETFTGRVAGKKEVVIIPG
jgi:hypothetical protein